MDWWTDIYPWSCQTINQLSLRLMTHSTFFHQTRQFFSETHTNANIYIDWKVAETWQSSPVSPDTLLSCHVFHCTTHTKLVPQLVWSHQIMVSNFIWYFRVDRLTGEQWFKTLRGPGALRGESQWPLPYILAPTVHTFAHLFFHSTNCITASFGDVYLLLLLLFHFYLTRFVTLGSGVL